MMYIFPVIKVEMTKLSSDTCTRCRQLRTGLPGRLGALPQARPTCKGEPSAHPGTCVGNSARSTTSRYRKGSPKKSLCALQGLPVRNRHTRAIFMAVKARGVCKLTKRRRDFSRPHPVLWISCWEVSHDENCTVSHLQTWGWGTLGTPEAICEPERGLNLNTTNSKSSL